MRSTEIRRGTARPTPRTVVHLAVADPDLAEDCRAAVTACGLSARDAELASPPPGCGVLLVDGRAATSAGERATAGACAAAGQVIAVASELAPGPVAGREPLCLPRETAELLQRLERAADGDSGGRLLLVGGAHGGAGASVLACVLARRCAERGETVLVEADPFGGTLELIAATEAVAGLRLDAVHAASGELDGEELWQALPRDGALAVAARRPAFHRDGVPAAGQGSSESASVAAAVARAALRSGRTVVCDAGRLVGVDPVLRGAADQVVLVARATVAGLCAATAALGGQPGGTGFAAVGTLAVRTMRGDALGAADVDAWCETAVPVDPATGRRPRLGLYRSSGRLAAALDGGGTLHPPRDMRDLLDTIVEDTDV